MARQMRVSYEKTDDGLLSNSAKLREYIEEEDVGPIARGSGSDWVMCIDVYQWGD